MANSADPDQLASSEANWSGSTLFAKKDISGFSRTRVKKQSYCFSLDKYNCFNDIFPISAGTLATVILLYGHHFNAKL